MISTVLFISRPYNRSLENRGTYDRGSTLHRSSHACSVNVEITGVIHRQDKENPAGLI